MGLPVPNLGAMAAGGLPAAVYYISTAGAAATKDRLPDPLRYLLFGVSPLIVDDDSKKAEAAAVKAGKQPRRTPRRRRSTRRRRR